MSKEYKAAWYQKNKLRMKELRGIRHEKNKDVRKTYLTEYRKKNPQVIRKIQSKYRLKNKAYYVGKCAERYARKTKSTPHWANKFFIEEIYDLALRRSKLKSGGHSKWHVDHIVPLKSDLVCGLHVHNNLQVIPSVHNLSKGNRHWPDMP